MLGRPSPRFTSVLKLKAGKVLRKRRWEVAAEMRLVVVRISRESEIEGARERARLRRSAGASRRGPLAPGHHDPKAAGVSFSESALAGSKMRSRST